MGWKKKILRFISGSNKPIFFIHTTDVSEVIISIIQDISGYMMNNESLFICINSKVPFYYENLNLNFKTLDDYLSVQDYESMDNFVYDFTRKWYLPKGTDKKGITEHEGIHLGSIVEYDFQLFLIRRLKWFVGMHKIITQENPDKIIILEDTGELPEASRLISDIFPTPILRLHDNIVPKDTYSLKQSFKSMLVDIIIFVIDFYFRFGLQFNTKGKIIIDKRVYDDLSAHVKLNNNFIPTPFEKGLKLRLSLIKRRFSYIPFYFPSNLRIKSKYFYKVYPKDFKELTNYNNVCIGKLIENKIKEYFTESFPRILKNIRLLKKLLRKKDIKAIILRHDLWELQKTCVETARRFSVSSIVVQHGVFGEKGEETIFADKIAVWGKMCVDIYKSFGNDPRKCQITGNPRLDVFFNSRAKFSRGQICDTLGLDKNKRIITLASGLYRSFLSSYMTGDENNIIISELILTMEHLPQYQLIIKLHPYENIEFSNRAIRYYNSNNVVAVKDFDIFSLINASDLLLTKRSTLGLKAMVLDKPVIVINFEKRQEINPYVRAGAVLEVNNIGDISKSIISALENSNVINEFRAKSQGFVQDYAHKIDGHSAQRVLDFIEHVAGNNKRTNYKDRFNL